MNLYRVYAVFNDNFGMTAVVACEEVGEAIRLSDYSGDDYGEHEVDLIGETDYFKEPTLVCSESL